VTTLYPEVSVGQRYRRLAKDTAALLLVDHQAGLMNLVRDFDPTVFQNKVLALAEAGRYFQLPTVLTTSFETGPNGPIVPDLRAMFPNAPFIPRPGEINAWDNPDFVNAVKATGRRQFIVAGIVTEVCVAFVSLGLIEAGYEVFVPVDCCGTFDEVARQAAWARMSAAGVQLVNWFAVISELHRDWRNDVQGLANLMAGHLPEYRHLIEGQRPAVKVPEPA
jgi:nicotinamidase-related amidase